MRRELASSTGRQRPRRGGGRGRDDPGGVPAGRGARRSLCPTARSTSSRRSKSWLSGSWCPPVPSWCPSCESGNWARPPNCCWTWARLSGRRPSSPREGRLPRVSDPMPPMYIGYFASRLARVDLPAALAPGRSHRRPGRSGPSTRQPRRENRGQPSGRGRGAGGEDSWRETWFLVTLRICQNMAPADMVRARRIATAQEDAALRTAALVFTAYGLPPSERNTARDLVRQALAEADQARAKFDPRLRILPALMPIVEQIDPALVPEFYWRTVADLAVANDPREEYGRDDVTPHGASARPLRPLKSPPFVFEPAVRAGAVRGTAPR